MCHSRENGNPVRMDPQSEALCFRLRMTRGLSVEDDKRVGHSRTPSVIPVKTGIQAGLDPQSEALRFRLRMTRKLSVEDDKGCVIPMKTGIQIQLDPQSEALRFRLRMTGGLSVEDDGREWIPHQVRDDTGQSKHRIIHKKQSEKCPTSSTKLPHLGDVGVWWK